MLTGKVESNKRYDEIFLLAGRKSWEDLSRAYRKACLETHPDQGGTNEAFLKVQEDYRTVILALERRDQVKQPDPVKEVASILKEAGWPGGFGVRADLYFAFDLYYRFSLYDFNVRSATPLQSRNGRLYQALIFFGSQYDVEFGRRFLDFHEMGLMSFSTTPQARTWSGCRADFWHGWNYFFRFQAEGRISSRRVAFDYWEGIGPRLEKAKLINTPLEEFTRWFLEELDKDPVLWKT